MVEHLNIQNHKNFLEKLAGFFPVLWNLSYISSFV